MKKYVSDVSKAPKAIGPYSQAVVAGNLVFTSGQIPINPETGEIVQGGIEAQAEQVLKSLQAILHHLDLDFGHVAKTTIFLTDLSHFQTVNGIYEKWLGSAKPARSTIQVAALPKGSMIEIEMLAIRD